MFGETVPGLERLGSGSIKAQLVAKLLAVANGSTADQTVPSFQTTWTQGRTQTVSLNFVDTTGQEENSLLYSEALAYAAAVLLTCDVMNPEALNALKSVDAH